MNLIKCQGCVRPDIDGGHGCVSCSRHYPDQYLERLKVFTPVESPDFDTENPAWPDNLYCAAFHIPKGGYSERPAGLNEENVMAALDALSEAQQKVIIAHYKEKKTLSAVAKSYGVTVERISQLHQRALRILSRPNILPYFLYGKDYVESQEKAARAITLSSPIEQLGFNARAKNSLRRIGCVTVRDLLCFSPRDLCGVRNVGRKTTNEIEKTLSTHGYSLRKEF